MTFTTFSFLLAGAAAALIPIAIHLLSKGKPKKIVFPALRFAQAKLATNKRKLTVKRLLLLFLRVALFALLGLALARPFFIPQPTKTIAETAQNAAADADVEQGESVGLANRDDVSASAIVIDTSVRMGRIRDNASLFDRAIETARAIVDQTPSGAEIAVLDGTYDGDAFQPDRIAARERLAKLEIEPYGRSAAQSTLEAIALLKRSQASTKEIFVLTDCTRASWAERDLRMLRKQLSPEENPNVTPPTLYFVDLGDDSYRDAAIVDLALSAETISIDGSLRVDVEIERIGDAAADVAVETVFFDAKKLPDNLVETNVFTDPSLALRRETQTVSFEEGRVKRSIHFNTSNLPLGTNVGAVRILGGDALSSDDVRWFAVDVAQEWKLLVVAPYPIDEKALFITQALAPEDLKISGRAPFELDVIPYKYDPKKHSQNKNAKSKAPRDLASMTVSNFDRYRAVILLDPTPLDATTLKNLAAFADAGGGVAVFLGRNATQIGKFQTPEAIKLLGYKPTTQIVVDSWNAQINPDDYSEPLLASFRPFERLGVPWDACPIGRYWKLTELSETASIVAKFATIGSDENKETDLPALVENRVGRGLVVTLATPISDTEQDKPWNALVSGDAAWVFVVFADGLARRLASASSSILNYTAGETATLRSPLKVFPAVADVTTPDGKIIKTPADVERRQIRFPGAKQPGVYRVRTTPNKDGERIDAAFAVATPDAEFDLSRYSQEDWAKHWEGVPYKTLDLQATGEALDAARRGKESEPYAFLAVLLAVLFLVETAVANRFYKK